MTTPVYKGSFATNKRHAIYWREEQCTRARLRRDRVNLTFVCGPCGLKNVCVHECAGLVCAGRRKLSTRPRHFRTTNSARLRAIASASSPGHSSMEDGTERPPASKTSLIDGL